MAVQREYLSPNEIAELLGVSPFTIRRYIKLGELKAVKLLGGFRVHRDDLQSFLKAHEVNSGDEQVSDEETEVAAPVQGPEMPAEAASHRTGPGPDRSSKAGSADESRSRGRKPVWGQRPGPAADAGSAAKASRRPTARATPPAAKRREPARKKPHRLKR